MECTAAFGSYTMMQLYSHNRSQLHVPKDALMCGAWCNSIQRNMAGCVAWVQISGPSHCLNIYSIYMRQKVYSYNVLKHIDVNQMFDQPPLQRKMLQQLASTEKLTFVMTHSGNMLLHANLQGQQKRVVSHALELLPEILAVRVDFAEQKWWKLVQTMLRQQIGI